MIFLSILLTSIASAIVAFQKTLNAGLGKCIGSIEGSFVNHLVGFIFGLLILVIGYQLDNINLGNTPFYLFLGGAAGIFMVSFVNYAIAHIGIMNTLIYLIISQSITSLIIDHYGLINHAKIPMNPLRIIGILLIICGAKLALSRTTPSK